MPRWWLRRAARRRLAVHEHLAARRRLEVGEDPQDRRLPAARRPEERDEGALGDVEVDALERDDRGLRSTLNSFQSACSEMPSAGATRRGSADAMSSSVVTVVACDPTSVVGSTGEVFSSGFSSYTSSITDMSNSLSWVM